jgi:hypothetical protein
MERRSVGIGVLDVSVSILISSLLLWQNDDRVSDVALRSFILDQQSSISRGDSNKCERLKNSSGAKGSVRLLGIVGQFRTTVRVIVRYVGMLHPKAGLVITPTLNIDNQRRNLSAKRKTSCSCRREHFLNFVYHSILLS